MESPFSFDKFNNHILSGIRETFDETSQSILPSLENANSAQQVEQIGQEIFTTTVFLQKSNNPKDIILLDKANSLQLKIMNKYNELLGNGAKIENITALNSIFAEEFLNCLDDFNDEVFTNPTSSIEDIVKESFSRHPGMNVELLLSHFAEQGNAIALLLLALLQDKQNLNGHHIKFSEEAFSNLKKSASEGNPNAIYYLGLALNITIEERKKFMAEAEKLGHVGALIRSSIDEDSDANECLKQAYENASEKASSTEKHSLKDELAYNLGKLYLKADDLEESLTWMSKIENSTLRESGTREIMGNEPDIRSPWDEK
jgi:tetratricopeptide (TPR) repeat protein